MKPENKNVGIVSDDEDERINSHISYLGVKQSTGSKQHPESNFNDRVSEQTSIANLKNSPPLVIKNNEKPAAAGVVPFL
jgi:hypothetical protein